MLLHDGFPLTTVVSTSRVCSYFAQKEFPLHKDIGSSGRIPNEQEITYLMGYYS